MAKWYYQNDGTEHGPVDSRTLKQLAASGQIQALSLLRREDRENWVKAASVKGLLPEGVTPQSKSESSETPTSDKATQASASQSIDWNSWPVICGSLILCFPVGLYLIWKHPTWQTRTKWMWTGGFFAVAIFGNVMMRIDKEQTSARVSETHAMWQRGDKAEAISEYRKLIDDKLTLIDPADQVRLFQRLIDFDAEKGDRDSAFELLARAERLGLTISLESEEGKAIFEERERNKERSQRKLAANNPIVLKEAALFTNSTDDRVEFEDNTKKFEGKAVRMKLAFDKMLPSLSSFQRDNLNTNPPRPAEFWVYADNPRARFQVIIDIPADLDIPKLHSGDDFDVTFFCEKGSTQFGNVAIKIERH